LSVQLLAECFSVITTKPKGEKNACSNTYSSNDCSSKYTSELTSHRAHIDGYAARQQLSPRCQLYGRPDRSSPNHCTHPEFAGHLDDRSMDYGPNRENRSNP